MPRAVQDHSQLPLAQIALGARDLGWDSLWVSDHTVMPITMTSDYPYTDDRQLDAPAATPWHDLIICMAMIAAATKRTEVGSWVLLLPLRDPVIVAKQIATIDRLTASRLALAVGGGWMKAEFDLLGVPFTGRGHFWKTESAPSGVSGPARRASTTAATTHCLVRW